MNNFDIVIGANYGDEGKGTVVANLVKNYKRPLIVLTNGGPQRAHSIVLNGKTITNKHFGSGTHLGADNYFAKTFIVNPMQFVLEQSRNEIPREAICWMDPDCKWTTPWDIMLNLVKEEARDDSRHGSCGMGIWETICRYKLLPSLNLADYLKLDEDQKKKYLISIRNYLTPDFLLCNPDEATKESWFSEYLIQHFNQDIELMMKQIRFCSSFDNLLKLYPNIIFENGQGLLLTDPGYDKPGSTPSNTGLDDIIPFLNNNAHVDVHYITRPYLTRHGIDKEFNAVKRLSISSGINTDLTNHWNPNQRDFMYSNLDINDLSVRIKKDYNKLTKKDKNLIIDVTHCDEMDRESEFRKTFNNVNFIDKAEII